MKLSTPSLVRRWFATAALLLTGALFAAPANAAPTASLEVTCQDPGPREQLAQLRRQIAELRAAQAELRRELERLHGAHGQAHGGHAEKAHGEHAEEECEQCEECEECEECEIEEVEHHPKSPHRAQGFAFAHPGARGFLFQGARPQGMRGAPVQFNFQGRAPRGQRMAGRPQGRAPAMTMRGFAMPRMQMLRGPSHVTWQIRGDGHEGNAFTWRGDAPAAKAKAKPKSAAKPKTDAKPKSNAKAGGDNQSIWRSLQLAAPKADARGDAPKKDAAPKILRWSTSTDAAPGKQNVFFRRGGDGEVHEMRIETDDVKGGPEGHRVLRLLRQKGADEAGEHEVRVEVHPEIRIQRAGGKAGAPMLRVIREGDEGAGSKKAQGFQFKVEIDDDHAGEKGEKAEKKADKKPTPKKKISVSV